MKTENLDGEAMELLEYVKHIKIQQTPTYETNTTPSKGTALSKQGTHRNSSGLKGYEKFMANIFQTRSKNNRCSSDMSSIESNAQVRRQEEDQFQRSPQSISKSIGVVRSRFNRASDEQMDLEACENIFIAKQTRQKRISHVQIEFSTEFRGDKVKGVPVGMQPNCFSSKLQKKLKVKERFRRKIIDEANRYNRHDKSESTLGIKTNKKSSIPCVYSPAEKQVGRMLVSTPSTVIHSNKRVVDSVFVSNDNLHLRNKRRNLFSAAAERQQPYSVDKKETLSISNTISHSTILGASLGIERRSKSFFEMTPQQKISRNVMPMNGKKRGFGYIHNR